MARLESKTICIQDHAGPNAYNDKHFFVERMLLRLGHNWRDGTAPEAAVAKTKRDLQSPDKRKGIWLLRPNKKLGAVTRRSSAEEDSPPCEKAI